MKEINISSMPNPIFNEILDVGFNQLGYNTCYNIYEVIVESIWRNNGNMIKIQITEQIKNKL